MSFPKRFATLIPALFLLVAACGDDGGGSGSCESPATEISAGQSVQSELAATSEPYPATATYYCIEVPSGTGRLVIVLSDLTADLDLYVGLGSIEAVQGVDLDEGETYDWLSNDFGTVDEEVVIDDPAAGAYYIEIVSFAGDFSEFTLVVTSG